MKWESNPRTRVHSQEIIADIVFMVPKVGLEPTRRSIWFWIRQVYQFHHLGILLNKYCYEFYTMSLFAQTVRTICSFPTILFNNLAMRGIYYSLCLQPLRRTPLWLFGMDVIADASGGQGGCRAHYLKKNGFTVHRVCRFATYPNLMRLGGSNRKFLFVCL